MRHFKPWATALIIVSVAVRANAGGGASSSNAKGHFTNFQAASVVIGQPNSTGNQANQGMDNPTANTIANCFGSIGVGAKNTLYLSDYENQRVLGFFGIPSSNDENADFELGQPNLTTAGKGDNANQFGGPQSPFISSKKLFVSDFFDSRVLIWNKAPTTDDVPADIVIGQPGFGTRDSACSPTGMSAPETLAVAGNKLVVADSSNSRVLIYKKIPTKNGAAPDIVLGQQNLSTCVTLNNGSGATGAPTAANFTYPAGVWTDGTRVVVTDEDESRVLIWKKFPKKNFQPADIVLGQPSFTTDTKNNNGSNSTGSPSAQNLNQPYDGVYSDGTQLFVDDQENQRILIWNKFPTKNFQAADVVLGHQTFNCGVADDDGTCKEGPTSANNFSEVTGITEVGKQLIVCDGQARYLIFDGN